MEIKLLPFLKIPRLPMALFLNYIAFVGNNFNWAKTE